MRFLILLAFWGYAVAQPLFDLLGETTTFFLSHNADSFDVVLFSLIVCFLGPLICYFGLVLTRRLNATLATGLEASIHAVLIASPEHWHAQHIIDALEAGKDVYTEKPMTLRLDQGLAVRKAIEKHSDRIFQVGTQAEGGALCLLRL